MTAPCAGPAAAGTQRRDAWEERSWQWDAYYACIVTGTLALVWLSGPYPARDRLLASAALLAMIPWYVLVGRPAIFGSGSKTPRPLLYVAGLVPLLSAATIASGTTTFILLALCPQCFMALRYRQAVASVAVLCAIPVVVAAAQGVRGAALAALAGISVLSLVFSAGFGGWIVRIIAQSTERAELIAQLEATQAELAQANREAGMLAERQRLSSEIHDTIAQGFTSIVMLIQAAEAELDGDQGEARRHLAMAGRTARESLAEARGLVGALAPPQLETATLDQALRRLTDQVGSEHGIGSRFLLCGPPRRLPTGTEVMLLRVCQEALANVRKHARAEAASVTLTYGQDIVGLEVADDGIGFAADQVNGGYGLRGMRGRVDSSGGSLVIHSAPGAGTSVRVEVPG